MHVRRFNLYEDRAVNNQIEVDDSMLQVHAFELSRTLDETGWSGVLGKTGLGWRLLNWMQTLAAPYFELGPIHSTEVGHAEVLSFELEGLERAIELGYEQPLTATLLMAAREVINGVNQALKCAQMRFRFILERQTSTGNQSRYRLILTPHAWLAVLGRSMNLVAGISPEDYERDMLAPGRALRLRDLDFSDPGEPHSLR